MTADSGSPASDAGVSTDAPKLSPALVPGWTGADHWQALELAKPGRDEPFYINRLARAFLLVVHDLRAERSRLRSLSEENARLTAALAAHDAKQFPIQDGPSIPWSAIAPFEHQAKKNHAQSLERLADRGGLSVLEALCVMTCAPLFGDECKAFAAMSKRAAILKLGALAVRPASPAPGETATTSSAGARPPERDP